MTCMIETINLGVFIFYIILEINLYEQPFIDILFLQDGINRCFRCFIWYWLFRMFISILLLLYTLGVMQMTGHNFQTFFPKENQNSNVLSVS